MNQIQTEQNRDSSLNLLKAQRVAYGQAKKISRVELVNVWIACLLPFVFFWLGPSVSGEIKLYLSSAVIAVSLFLSGYEKHRTSVGAKIQEDFDCRVLNIRWNEVLCGKKILPDQIGRLSSQYKRDDLANWYSSEITQDLDHSTAVLMCQSSNLYWDNELRRKYNRVIVTTAVAYILVLGVFFVLEHQTFADAALILLPTLPFFKHILSSHKSNIDIINNKVDLAHRIEKLLAEEPSVRKEIDLDIRRIQDAIFNLRKSTTKVPDWYHERTKEKLEEEIAATVRHQKKTLEE